MGAARKIFYADSAEKRWKRIALWWEIRRPLYNVFLVLFAALTLAIMSVIPQGYVRFQAGPMLVVGAVLASVLYFLGANVCYTAGSIVQIMVKDWNQKFVRKYVGSLFLLGVTFSLVATLSLVLLGIANWILGFWIKVSTDVG
jgi:hypothetical protein